MPRPSSKSNDSTTSSKFQKKALSSIAQFATSSPQADRLSAMLIGNNPSFCTLTDEIATVEFDVKKRMAFHLSQAESKVDELRSTMNNALLCLPKEIQNMNVQEYIQRFGGNRHLFVENAMNTSRAEQFKRAQDTAKKAISRSAHKKTNSSSSIFINSNNAVPSTPIGTHSEARHAPSSVLQSRKTPGGTLNSTLAVSIGNETVQLTPGQVSLLNTEQKREVGQHMENLAAQVNRIKSLLQ